MANINLISARRAERVRFTRIARGMVLAVLGAAGLGLATSAYSVARLVMTNARLVQIEQKLTELRPVLAEIEANEAERRALMPKLVTLTQAQAATRRWFGMMEGLKRAVPDQTWFTNLAVESNAETGQRLKINGVTVNQTRVGETMLRLNQQAEYYSSVNLNYTNRKGDVGEVEFELAAQLVQPQSEAANATQAN